MYKKQLQLFTLVLSAILVFSSLTASNSQKSTFISSYASSTSEPDIIRTDYSNTGYFNKAKTNIQSNALIIKFSCCVFYPLFKGFLDSISIEKDNFETTQGAFYMIQLLL